jgi:hypothetical protein
MNWKRMNRYEKTKWLALNIMGWPHLLIGQMTPSVGFFDRGNHIELRYKDARGNCPTRKWCPFLNLSDAMELIGAMKAKGYSYGLFGVSMFSSVTPDEHVVFSHGIQPPALFEKKTEAEGYYHAYAPNLQVAICECAAKAWLGRRREKRG